MGGKGRTRTSGKNYSCSTGYVGLSNAILFAQHNEVRALEVVEEKVNLINQKSPIVDKEIEEYLANKRIEPDRDNG